MEKANDCGSEKVGMNYFKVPFPSALFCLMYNHQHISDLQHIMISYRSLSLSPLIFEWKRHAKDLCFVNKGMTEITEIHFNIILLRERSEDICIFEVHKIIQQFIEIKTEIKLHQQGGKNKELAWSSARRCKTELEPQMSRELYHARQCHVPIFHWWADISRLRTTAQHQWWSR